MARNEIEIAAPIEDVWGVLADPRLYAIWVLGAASVRAVDGTWPEPGSTFHHTQSVLVRDTTSVLESEPPRHLRLEARARPLVVVSIDIQLSPAGADRTSLVLEEQAIGGLGGALPLPLRDPLIRLRNAIAVRRLRDLAQIAVLQPGARRG
jgi:uncharacterized protein YndB with AHSA1/START domain